MNNSRNQLSRRDISTRFAFTGHFPDFEGIKKNG